MRVSQMTLAINDPANCPRRSPPAMNASVHYHDVDDPADTTFVMASMWNAGLRIFDVRDPLRPTEVAYFNPGMFRRRRTAGSSTRRGAMSATTPSTATSGSRRRRGGFWVVELEPQVRRRSASPPFGARTRTAARPRPADTLGVLGAPAFSTAQYYCTLGPVTS